MRLSHLLRPRHVVVSSLAGGLGNQLFQYAFGRAVALQHHCDLVLDTRILQIKDGQTPRELGLSDFNIQASIDTLSRQQLDRCIAVKESVSNYDAGVMHKTAPGCRLAGYWQTERYFGHIRPTLLTELTLRAPVTPYIQRLADQIASTPQSVSVHFRRGDYVSDPKVAAFHGVCSMDYYNNAIQSLTKQVHNSRHFFLFSDDPDWLATNIPAGVEPYTIVDARQSSAREDLWLMSLCRHHVVANSSFSWWGAWLSRHEGINIAPGRWFQAPSFNDQDIVPASWQRL